MKINEVFLMIVLILISFFSAVELCEDRNEMINCTIIRPVTFVYEECPICIIPNDYFFELSNSFINVTKPKLTCADKTIVKFNLTNEDDDTKDLAYLLLYTNVNDTENFEKLASISSIRTLEAYIFFLECKGF